MDENLKHGNFYDRLFGRPVSEAEVDEVIQTLQDNALVGNGVLEALLTLKDPVLVTKLMTLSQFTTEKQFGQCLRQGGRSFQAGFITGMVHGCLVTTQAFRENRDAPVETGAAILSMLLFAIGTTMKQDGSEWPEELNETIQ